MRFGQRQHDIGAHYLFHVLLPLICNENYITSYYLMGNLWVATTYKTNCTEDSHFSGHSTKHGTYPINDIPYGSNANDKDTAKHS